MWCNGNTTDFDSVIVGSNPAISGGKIKYSFMILLSDFFGGSERREVPCRVQFRLARCASFLKNYKELIQYANQTQPIVSALLCLMG